MFFFFLNAKSKLKPTSIDSFLLIIRSFHLILLPLLPLFKQPPVPIPTEQLLPFIEIFIEFVLTIIPGAGGVVNIVGVCCIAPFVVGVVAVIAVDIGSITLLGELGSVEVVVLPPVSLSRSLYLE